MRKILIILSALIFSFSVANARLYKAGHTANPDEPYHEYVGLKRIVEKETNGEVEIQIFPNGQLGSEKEMIEGLKLGTVDITSPSNGNPKTCA